MIDTKAKLRTADGVLFCFLAAMIAAILALNIGLLTEPEQILPKGLSMRSDLMNGNILRGIDLALEDIELIKAGVGSGDLWRLLTFVHLDVFFYLALIMPEIAAKTILTIGFYVRFGLACSAMYYFMSEHIKLNRLPSALLGAMYAFSSQLVLTAQFASVMDMAIMLPVLMSACDSYLQKRSWKNYVMVCACAFGLCASGGFGVITGLPAMIMISFLMCISLYQTITSVLFSWIKLVSGLIVGLILDMAFVIPGLMPMDFDVNVTESFKNAKVTYTLFDLIRGTFLLRSGGLSASATPVFYIGLFTISAIVLFALNERIPLRIKVASGIIAVIFHGMCCSSFVNETISVFGTAPLLTSSKLICLEIVLFFIAGIGLKNTKSVKRGEFIAAALIPLFFLVISNIDAAGTTLCSSIMVSTFIGVIVESAVLYAIATNKLPEIAKYVVLVLGFVFVCINATFLMFNNTITSSSAEEYFRGYQADEGSSELLFDRSFVLPAIGENDEYLFIPADLSGREASDSVIDDINYLSERATGEKLFQEVFVTIDEVSGLTTAGIDTYKLAEGRNKLSITPYLSSEGDRLFAYCDAKTGGQLRIDRDIGNSERAFVGPYITEIESDTVDFTLKFTVHSEKDEICHIAVYKLNEKAYDALRDMSGRANSSSFTVNNPQLSGTSTIVLPFGYSGSKIRVNGTSYETFSFCGKTAVTFDSSDGKDLNVAFENQETGLLPGILISVLAVLCLVAIPIIQRYNGKKNVVTSEGNDTNA